jgi:hypothetical protein
MQGRHQLGLELEGKYFNTDVDNALSLQFLLDNYQPGLSNTLFGLQPLFFLKAWTSAWYMMYGYRNINAQTC